MTHYREGDCITLVIDEAMAHYLNKSGNITVRSGDITEHTPRPEPIVGWVNVYKDGEFGMVYFTKEYALENKGSGNEPHMVTIKLSFDPVTRTPTATVEE